MTIVVGVGLRSSVEAEALESAVRRVVAETGVAWEDVSGVATVVSRGDHPAVQALVAAGRFSLFTFTAAELAAVAVPTPSADVAARIGTASVAEAAALLACDGGRLIVPKRTLGPITLALATSE